MHMIYCNINQIIHKNYYTARLKKKKNNTVSKTLWSGFSCCSIRYKIQNQMKIWPTEEVYSYDLASKLSLDILNWDLCSLQYRSAVSMPIYSS